MAFDSDSSIETTVNREIDEFGETASKHIVQVQKHLTLEDIETLIAEYQSGKTLVELSKEFGCHQNTVGKILERNGIEKHPYRESRAEEVVAGYQSGKSVRTLAKEFGADHKTISRVLKEHGITVNRRRAQVKMDATKVVEMYAEMHTTKEIAQQFGVSAKAVIQCLHDQGVKMRGRWDYERK